MVDLALVAELLVLAWAQLSFEVSSWSEGSCGRCVFSFQAAMQLRCGSASTSPPGIFDLRMSNLETYQK